VAFALPRRAVRHIGLGVLGMLAAASIGAESVPEPETARSALEQVLGASTEGFARATAVRAFRFPDDHGPHPAYRSEWWYFTGNVTAPGGRRFGFQLTFFRFALAPGVQERASAWASNQVYMAHFAVSDVAAGRFHAAEAFSREALDLAGARAAPFRVWLGTWHARSDAGFFPLSLHAEDGGYQIDLRLDAGKPVVLNGEAGLSRKSAEPGNASYYYSIPRIPVRGRLATPDGAWQVRGSAWFDREWSSSALAADQAGWDWFALQLSDGRDLMVYRLRTRDGGTDPASGGTLVEADGRARSLGAGEFLLDALDHWSSPRGDARYPARWRLRVPDAAIDVEITPEIADQELNFAFRYYEGASRVSGTSNSVEVTGHGHVELTGYTGSGAAVTR
jgi:predicted secreted hydrolase